ncbi:MAG: D-2-hydroxyacid dehydrogenase [Spirochaetaceae bacterium]|nr:D-2-hydroxyacid dehydrogenase [Spirochaetaceae bacterium]
MKKLVVLDKLPLDDGQLNWLPLEALTAVTYYDNTLPGQLTEHLKAAEMVLTNKVVLNRDILAANPQLKYIGVMATGFNVVDVQAAKELGIIVTNIPSYSTDSVAELIMAFILEASKKVVIHNNAVHKGDWANSPLFAFYNNTLTEIKGKTLGIIGFGNIGQRVAQLADAFGMLIKCYVPRPKAEPNLPNFKFVSLDDLLTESDYLALCCPLTADNNQLINKANINKMKKTAYLINTGRGGLINEADLAAALNSGRLAGASVDVLSSEPPSAANPLLSAKNIVITPHIAWATLEARIRLVAILTENVKAYLAGTPQNQVNK